MSAPTPISYEIAFLVEALNIKDEAEKAAVPYREIGKKGKTVIPEKLCGKRGYPGVTYEHVLYVTLCAYYYYISGDSEFASTLAIDAFAKNAYLEYFQ